MKLWKRLFDLRIRRVKVYRIPIIKCHCKEHGETSALFTAMSVDGDDLFITVVCSKCFEVER